jgi:hypothetical protein
MRKYLLLLPAARALLFCAIASIFLWVALRANAEELPKAIGDEEFWRIVTQLSEAGGIFQAQLMSNEDSAQFVIPALQDRTKPGGVYIGVGSEQNFTYIAAIKPRLAFIIDIRRDNLLEHLMYKALFEMSKDRADFLSRLFSRKRPAGLDSNSTVDTLFEVYRSAESDPLLYDENLRRVMDRLLSQHKFQLSEAERTKISTMMNIFRGAGPFNLRGTGDRNASYADLMEATDLMGRHRSYLASEENFRTVQELEKRNLIVPIIGDFAGEGTIIRLGQYLRDHDATADVFYLSNVERYLFQQNEEPKKFYANVRTLPLNESSVFIRSVTVDVSRRLGIPLSRSAENWRSFLVSIRDCLDAFDSGRIQTYRDLFNPN